MTTAADWLTTAQRLDQRSASYLSSGYSYNPWSLCLAGILAVRAKVCVHCTSRLTRGALLKLVDH